MDLEIESLFSTVAKTKSHICNFVIIDSYKYLY